MDFIDGKIIPARQHIPTDPKEYGKQIERILKSKDLTLEELAKEIKKPVEWVFEMWEQRNN